MRCFIAFDIPEKYYNYLQDIQNQLKKNCKGTTPYSFHLTLKFLGNINEKKLDIIQKELNLIEHKSFKAQFSNLGAFPSISSPRVIWIGLEPYKIIQELQQKIEQTLNYYSKFSERFHPHITLMRVKNVENKAKLKEFLQTKQEQYSFQVSYFTLYQSKPSDKKHIYIPLQTYKLENKANI
ncbi:RNA 2',3'-cyclic phosphodiesterase [Candidatus Woesearchaeota archaeon]|nr:RNA 2',3'-cyclic phosphodiesterase [Candidatus Woesearchaeota archaeon]